MANTPGGKMLEFNQLRTFLEIAQKSGYRIESKGIQKHQVLQVNRDLPGIQRSDSNWKKLQEVCEHGLCIPKTILVTPNQPRKLLPLPKRLEKVKQNVERRMKHAKTEI